MKNIVLLLAIAALFTASCGSKSKSKNENEVSTPQKTQAYLGLAEGGEWKWVTKKNGNEQWEYQGGEFKPVQALKVDEKHTDHSFDIQMEGPAWESDKIGYRIYLDWRNAIDIFGKKTEAPVLHRVGLDGFDSYHEIADWGVDVLKVGSSLGMGSVAFWNGEKAVRVEKTDSIKASVKNYAEKSAVSIDYFGWEINNTRTDLHTTLEIEADAYLTKYTIKSSEEMPNLATGIVVLPETERMIFEDIKPGWDCLATFGKQTLQQDLLGMCIFYKKEQLLEETNDGKSHVVVLKPTGKMLTYYFGAAWQQDASGVKSMDDFKALLKEQAGFIK
ncbi:protein of unknown function [Mariniphaga anaerophila]|uniref:DUF4861 domain-containing protein n=1 Tax=Mariniphaga anaerophila TaxID=1484053 RepID=A0A1M5BW96_9BACT|nr:DUF4861 family protein [Mariniphaga anaerophila]SHF46676.1 protein of unknown function [Mariniphaga anaerophila]